MGFRKAGSAIIGNLIVIMFITGCANFTVRTYSGLQGQQMLPETTVTVQASNAAVNNGAKITNNNGEAAFKLERGMYNVNCQRAGYFKAERTVNFSGDDANFDVEMVPQCMIMGSVVLFDGSIPEEAVVRVITQDNVKKGQAKSMDDGSFTIEPIAPGEYILTAETIRGAYYGETICKVDEPLKQIKIRLERKDYSPQKPEIDPDIIVPESYRPPSRY